MKVGLTVLGLAFCFYIIAYLLQCTNYPGTTRRTLFLDSFHLMGIWLPFTPCITIQLPIIILYPLHVLEVEVLVYFINVIPWGEGLPVKRKQSKIPNTVTVILPLSKPSNLQIPGRKKALICLYENRWLLTFHHPLNLPKCSCWRFLINYVRRLAR